MGWVSRISPYSAPIPAYPHQPPSPLGPTNRTAGASSRARVPVQAHAQKVSPIASADGYPRFVVIGISPR